MSLIYGLGLNAAHLAISSIMRSSIMNIIIFRGAKKKKITPLKTDGASSGK